MVFRFLQLLCGARRAVQEHPAIFFGILLVFFFISNDTLLSLDKVSIYKVACFIVLCFFGQLSYMCCRICCMRCVCGRDSVDFYFILCSDCLQAVGALHALSHQKNLVDKKCLLSQPIVGPEQKFKKFLKVCINEDLFIVFQRPAIYKKNLVFSCLKTMHQK